MKNYKIFSSKLGETDSSIKKAITKKMLKAIETEDRDRKTCQPTDLRDKLGPVRNQDTMGWCYAFAAADLLTADTGKTISAFDIALNYNNFKCSLKIIF